MIPTISGSGSKLSECAKAELSKSLNGSFLIWEGGEGYTGAREGGKSGNTKKSVRGRFILRTLGGRRRVSRGRRSERHWGGQEGKKTRVKRQALTGPRAPGVDHQAERKDLISLKPYLKEKGANQGTKSLLELKRRGPLKEGAVTLLTY